MPFRESNITCPYCGWEDHDSLEMFPNGSDGDEEEMECGKCEKTFKVTFNVDVSYTTEGMDDTEGVICNALNNGKDLAVFLVRVRRGDQR